MDKEIFVDEKLDELMELLLLLRAKPEHEQKEILENIESDLNQLD